MNTYQGKTAEEWTNSGAYINGNGHYQAALEAFNCALVANPKYAYAYYGRGTAYLYLNQYQLAIPDLSRAIDLSPDLNSTADREVNVGSHELRLLCYLGLKEYQKALIDSNYLIQLLISEARRSREKPDIPFNWYLHRGKAYVGLGKYKEAIADFDNAVNLITAPWPTGPWSRCNYSHAIFYHRGNAYFEQKMYRQASADYARALEELAENRPDNDPPVGLDDDVDADALRTKREEAARRLT